MVVLAYAMQVISIKHMAVSIANGNAHAVFCICSNGGLSGEYLQAAHMASISD